MVELSDEVRALFDRPNYADIAAVLPDGGPHTTPAWVAVEGDRIAFLTGPTSRKARNLERDGRVAISVTDHTNPFMMATVRGHVAEVLDGDAAWEVIDRISHKYIGQPYPVREDRVVFLIAPDRAAAYTFG